jgi:hypothetical protein
MDELGMHLQPSPVTANIFTEDSEETTFNRASHKPISWFCYVDMFVI